MEFDFGHNKKCPQKRTPTEGCPHHTQHEDCHANNSWTNCRGWKCYWSPAGIFYVIYFSLSCLSACEREIMCLYVCVSMNMRTFFVCISECKTFEWNGFDFLQVCDWTSGWRNMFHALWFCLLFAISIGMMTLPMWPMWSNTSLPSEQAWRHARKMPILHFWRLQLHWALRFKDLKCIPRAERGEVWASVTNLVTNTGLLQRNLWKQQHQSHQRESLPYWLLHQNLKLNTTFSSVRTTS